MSVGYSTEITTVDEQLYEKYLTGDVQSARAEYLKILNRKLDLLTKNLDEMSRHSTSTQTKVKRVIWQANLIQSAKSNLSGLAFAETTVRLKGGTTPQPVITKIFDAVLVIENNARDLQKYKKDIVNYEDQREIDSALTVTGKILLETVVFLHNTHLTDKRRYLFNKAKEYTDVPYTFEEFNVKHDDIDKLYPSPFTTTSSQLKWQE